MSGGPRISAGRYDDGSPGYGCPKSTSQRSSTDAITHRRVVRIGKVCLPCSGVLAELLGHSVGKALPAEVSRLPVVMDVTVRQAKRDRGDGEQFARYFDIAGDGLLRWMAGRRFVDITGKAFLEPGHDLSYEHVWFAESQGVVAGMVSGYSAADHARSRNGPLFRAAGVQSIRVVAAWLLAARLFNFMDRLPEGDWYLQAVAVGEEYRGAGIGSLLLDHAEHAASAAGAHRLALDVAVDNDSSRRLYERRGMTIEATSPSAPFVPGGSVDRMTKVL